MKLPFSVFKRDGRKYYSVKFKNDQTGGYLPALSTKKKTETEAIQVAFDWLKNGIPNRREVIPFKKYTLRDLAREAEISNNDALFICEELKRRGLLKSFVLTESSQAIDFIQFLKTFWDWDSPFVKEKLRKRHSIHKRHTVEMAAAVNKYWIPFFSDKKKMLGEIRRQDIEDFIVYLESLKEKAEQEQQRIDRELEEEAIREQNEIKAGIRKPKRKNAATKKRTIIRFPNSAKRLNTIIQSGTIAISWAYRKEMIDRDVTSGITWFSGKSKERQILTPEQAAAVFRVQWKDDRSRLANMLAMVTGMRAGEIQSLKIEDLGNDCLYVRHSWNIHDGIKTTKNNETRTVEVPFPGLIQEIIDLAKRNPHGYHMESFVFWAEKKADKPMEQDIFRRDLKDALIKSGLSKGLVTVYTFHGWRHYFASYMKERVTEKLLQQQAGWNDASMVGHYGNHRIAGDKERIQKAQIESFGKLLPNYTNIVN
jgi:integrase